VTYFSTETVCGFHCS